MASSLQVQRMLGTHLFVAAVTVGGREYAGRGDHAAEAVENLVYVLAEALEDCRDGD